MKEKYSNIRGTSDFDVPESSLFSSISQKARTLFGVFNYQELILPLLEEKGLFIKGVGETTDIVERQMFKIEGKDIVLRPEGTAQVVRYYLQNSLYHKSNFHKFFYLGPMFRGERPQKGRLRQFHHIGAEAIGSNSFYIDAEIISLSLQILDAIGVKDKELKINSLGCLSDKVKFTANLKKQLINNKSSLCDDCKIRLEKNPLRVVDCKKEECRKIVATLDLGTVGFCDSCKTQFKNLLSLLTDLGIKYTSTPYLVRGLDYYTNTVFEITSNKLGSQDAIGAGGRYNNLIKSLGGPDIPATGFALGIERILLTLENAAKEQKLDLFIAVTDNSLLKEGFNIMMKLRQEGISCDYDYCERSLKSQLRFAQKQEAKFVVIIGEREMKDNSLLLKDMQNSTQEVIQLKDLAKVVKDRTIKKE
ncbi:MAG: histidine--tRNA ligase [Candidatus Omnitrophica bacterium]|nr:histidine--tRNA ligase [Candidatus Omnitrophota bacterium]